MCGKPGYKKLDCRVKGKISQEEWRAIKRNTEKRKASALQSRYLEAASTEIVPHSGVHVLS